MKGNPGEDIRDYDPSEALDIARSLVTYNPETGEFINPRTGKPRGHNCDNGHGGKYVRISLGRYGEYYAHTLAYFLMTGTWPPAGRQVDHINRNGRENEWDNLRLATFAQQRWNINGERGVCFDPRYGTWRAHITTNGVTMSKRCKTEAEARAFRAQWVAEQRIWE